MCAMCMSHPGFNHAPTYTYMRKVGCGVVCGVVWCGVVWCGVVWCGVVTANQAPYPILFCFFIHVHVCSETMMPGRLASPMSGVIVPMCVSCVSLAWPCWPESVDMYLVSPASLVLQAEKCLCVYD